MNNVNAAVTGLEEAMDSTSIVIRNKMLVVSKKFGTPINNIFASCNYYEDSKTWRIALTSNFWLESTNKSIIRESNVKAVLHTMDDMIFVPAEAWVV